MKRFADNCSCDKRRNWVDKPRQRAKIFKGKEELGMQKVLVSFYHCPMTASALEQDLGSLEYSEINREHQREIILNGAFPCSSISGMSGFCLIQGNKEAWF